MLDRLGIEITESALSRDTATIKSALRRIAAGGVAIAIDDFGTGFSSLSRHSQYPVDLLKIDRSFVSDLGTPTGRGIVASIVALAHSIGAAACAEGVEHAWQLTVLAELGVDTVSGHYLCRPSELEHFPDAAATGGGLLLAAERPIRELTGP